MKTPKRDSQGFAQKRMLGFGELGTWPSSQGNLPEQQPVTSKDKVSCEVYSMGETGKNREGRFRLK